MTHHLTSLFFAGAQNKLEKAQPYFKIGIPLFVLFTIPLTIWIAVTFRDPSIKAFNAQTMDLNKDGRLDDSDWQLFQEDYLAGDFRADTNQDGRVDSSDFALFSKFYKPKQ